MQFEMTPGKPVGFLLMAVLHEEAILLSEMHAGVIVLWDMRVLFFAGFEDLAAHSSGSPPHQ